MSNTLRYPLRPCLFSQVWSSIETSIGMVVAVVRGEGRDVGLLFREQEGEELPKKA